MTWLTDAIRYEIAAKAFSLSQDGWSWASEALTGSGARRTQRSWKQADMQLYSDERALAHAGAAKVCQMVKNRFAAQLAIRDADMRLRLLVD